MSMAQLKPDPTKAGRNELDSHADTVVAGDNCVVLEPTGRTVSVSPFSDEYDSIDDIPIATVATAYDCPTTGQVYVLVFNEALYFGSRMDHTLLCPNQLRDYGLRVEDTPRQYNIDSSHSILVPDHQLRIPLTLEGIISGFNSRQPTIRELEEIDRHVEMTSEVPWTPDSTSFMDAEEAIENDGDRTRVVDAARKCHIIEEDRKQKEDCDAGLTKQRNWRWLRATIFKTI